MGGKEIEVLFFPQEACVIRSDGIDQGDQRCTGLIMTDVIHILGVAAEPALTHALAQTGGNQHLLAVVKINADPLIDEFLYLAKLTRFQFEDLGTAGALRHAQCLRPEARAIDLQTGS